MTGYTKYSYRGCKKESGALSQILAHVVNGRQKMKIALPFELRN